MPAIQVEVTGLDELQAKLAAINTGIDAALQRASRRLAENAVKAWRSVVTARTGRMRAALAFQVRVAGGGVSVAFFVGRSGFYYRFQKDAARWTAHVEQFVRDHAAEYIRREVDLLIERSLS